MTSTTQKFAWKDRDTAAHDILQLVYHAPPSISTLAFRLLGAIRSPNILPELKAILFDKTQNTQHRIYALRAIIQLSEDVFIPELESLTLDTILNPRANFQYHGDMFLGAVAALVDKHPVNRGWFFDVLDNVKEPKRLVELLQRWSYSDYSDDFQRLLTAKMLDILDNNPQFLTLDVIETLTCNADYNQFWLDEHINQIVVMCLAEVGSTKFRLVVRGWSKLADLLREKIDNFDDVVLHPINGIDRQNQATEPPKFLKSPAYQYLHNQYLDAADGDAYALKRLVRISNRYGRNIPFRAVAIHFIGKLYQQYDIALTLYRHVRYSRDDWGDELMPDSPVRYEAGEALLNLPTPETWAAVVDSYFIAPRDVFLDFQIAWITHLTDVLSGDTKKVYDGIHHAEPTKRRWFHALANISEEELNALTKDIR